MRKHVDRAIYRQNIEDKSRIDWNIGGLVGGVSARQGVNLTQISCCTAALLKSCKKIVNLCNWLRTMTPVTGSAGKSAILPGASTPSDTRLR
jgi:hypothetical protein